ncbi:DNA primase [Fructobacillus sp. M1-13]|uniref:DNA primase n=1 Tax=Fructobacillus papyriferae TaxID=2713171 RepID=A0ABS5QPK5_9LACO|nr:DNA primase [Fructobacillus papyriferae]MBS9334822.1 DNA primase [Fructobacillus papyriferae]MCD2158812.1 DNA primase [Fructobacillus papyriferae]
MAERIPQQVIDEVRAQTNLVDLVSQYTQLVKRGREWNGSCPFHEDRRPSFFVDDKKQVFHCFSCGRSGTAFSFLMEKEGYTYPQAILKLAEDEGISGLERYQGQPSLRQEKFQKIYELYDAAQKLYTHILLNTTAGEQALSYLKDDRQLDEETIRQYGLGFVPSNNVLLSYAREHNIDETVMKSAELFIDRDEELVRDRFNNRIVWPIKNDRGQVLGFSGRSLDPDNPAKYMNSPESSFFNKGKLLYNLDQAKGNIRAGQPAMIFEGFMDVISAAMAGVGGAVATMGTALTEEHVASLTKLTDKITLVYDGDAAGQKAAKRSIPLIRSVAPQVEIGVIALADNRDPDEVRRELGLPALKQALDQATQTPTEYLINAAKQDKNLQNQAQYLDFLRDVWPILTDASAVEQDYFLKKISEDYGSSLEALQSEFKDYQAAHPAQKNPGRAGQGGQRSSGSRGQKHSAGPGNGSEGAYPTAGDWDDSFIPDIDPLAGGGFETPAATAKGVPAPNWQDAPKPKISRVEKAEQGLLMAMIQEPSILAYAKEQADFSFVHPEYQLLLLLYEAYSEERAGADFDLAAFMDYVQKPDLNQKLLTMDRTFGTIRPQMDAAKDYLKVIVDVAPYEAQLQSLQQKIAQAKNQHDDAALMTLMTELINLKKEHFQQ